MATIFMLVGIPGSGKSTFSKIVSIHDDIKIISSDTVRNLHPDWEEAKIFPEVYRLIAEELKNNHNCIYDATNPTPKVRNRLVDNLKQYNVTYDIGVYYFDTPYKTCLKRIRKRNHMKGERYFPLKKLKNYVETIKVPTLEEGYKFVKIIKG